MLRVSAWSMTIVAIVVVAQAGCHRGRSVVDEMVFELVPTKAQYCLGEPVQVCVRVSNLTGKSLVVYTAAREWEIFVLGSSLVIDGDTKLRSAINKRNVFYFGSPDDVEVAGAFVTDAIDFWEPLELRVGDYDFEYSMVIPESFIKVNGQRAGRPVFATGRLKFTIAP